MLLDNSHDKVTLSVYFFPVLCCSAMLCSVSPVMDLIHCWCSFFGAMEIHRLCWRFCFGVFHATPVEYLLLGLLRCGFSSAAQTRPSSVHALSMCYVSVGSLVVSVTKLFFWLPPLLVALVPFMGRIIYLIHSR